jgi:hypothetical protein
VHKSEPSDRPTIAPVACPIDQGDRGARIVHASTANAPSEGAPLGIYAGSPSTPDSKGVFLAPVYGLVDQDSGEFFETRKGPNCVLELSRSRDPAAVRLERWALQSVARSIIPDSRTAKCLRVGYLPDGRVEVWHSPEHRSASYGGLITCASSWACPICASKISERRRGEIQQAIALWEAQGGAVLLLTLTHGHTLADPLAALVKGQQKALDLFFGCREGRKLMASLGRVGHIRSWEVTHGRKREVNNGWHPHFHILLFAERMPVLEPFEDWAFGIWWNACRLAGLPLPNRRFGVSLQDGEQAARYVTKIGDEPARGSWGLDSELTKGHIKRAKDGETPFDFLRADLAGNDLQARALFREFAAVFKGKRPLVWSRGLRDRFDLEERTDEEIAAEFKADAVILSMLTRDDWRLVNRWDLRGELLELSRPGNWEPVARMLTDLRARSPR